MPFPYGRLASDPRRSGRVFGAPSADRRYRLTNRRHSRRIICATAGRGHSPHRQRRACRACARGGCVVDSMHPHRYGLSRQLSGGPIRSAHARWGRRVGHGRRVGIGHRGACRRDGRGRGSARHRRHHRAQQLADAASREAAERTRRSRMVSAWADRTEPQHNTPKLIVLNTGPEVIFEWRTTFWIMDGCRTDGFVHEHKWAKAEDHLERSSLAPGVVRSIMITNLVSGSGGRSDVHGPGRTAMAAHRHRGSPCASDMSGLLVESCSARCREVGTTAATSVSAAGRQTLHLNYHGSMGRKRKGRTTRSSVRPAGSDRSRSTRIEPRRLAEADGPVAADQLRRLLADPTRNAALIRLILGSPQVDLYTMPVLASVLEPNAPHLRGVVRLIRPVLSPARLAKVTGGADDYAKWCKEAAKEEAAAARRKRKPEKASRSSAPALRKKKTAQAEPTTRSRPAKVITCRECLRSKSEHAFPDPRTRRCENCGGQPPSRSIRTVPGGLPGLGRRS